MLALLCLLVLDSNVNNLVLFRNNHDSLFQRHDGLLSKTKFYNHLPLCTIIEFRELILSIVRHAAEPNMSNSWGWEYVSQREKNHM
jgi:hypothetical protein